MLIIRGTKLHPGVGNPTLLPGGADPAYPDDPIPDPPPPPPPTDVEIPRISINTDLANTPSPGITYNVHNFTELQNAINICNLGDIIVLDAGGTYAGTILTLPFKSTGSGFVRITTSGSVPSEGNRLTQSLATSLGIPRIIRIGGDPSLPLLFFADSAKQYRFIGIMFGNDPSVSGVQSLIQIGRNDATLLSQLPDNIIFDRCGILPTTNFECRRGITPNAKSFSFIDGFVGEIHSSGFDSQAILCWNGAGPFKIHNSKLEASTEVVGFGGADPVISNLIPSDITISKCHITRPMAWKHVWFEKNLVEFKLGRRVLIHSNVIENAWNDAQFGWGFEVYSVNQQGGANWSVCEHFTFRDNLMRNIAAGYQITQTYGITPGTNHVAILNNLCIGMDNPAVAQGDYGFLIQQQVPYLYLEHNTCIMPPGSTSGLEIVMSQPLIHFICKNNLLGGGNYPAYFYPAGWAGIADAASDFAGNIVVGSADMGYPHTNYFPVDYNGIGLVGGAAAATSVTAAITDMALSPSSPYYHAGTDGASPGADTSVIAAATNGVVIP